MDEENNRYPEDEIAEMLEDKLVNHSLTALVYNPNNVRSRFVEELRGKINKVQKGAVVIAAKLQRGVDYIEVLVTEVGLREKGKLESLLTELEDRTEERPTFGVFSSDEDDEAIEVIRQMKKEIDREEYKFSLVEYLFNGAHKDIEDQETYV